MTSEDAAPTPESRFAAFGLLLASEIDLPELPRGEAPGAPDINIRFGDVPAALDGGVIVEPGITAAVDMLLMDFEPARYLILGGRQIVVEPKPGGSERDIRAYLLGSAIGAVCHQRGLLPLHANAVEIDGKAVAFAGPSGAGKSTLAAHFRSQGRRVLCDDICVITFDSVGKPLAWPGIPRIKLWSDALAAFGGRADDLERVFGVEDKFSLPIASGSSLEPLSLERVYLLEKAGRERAFHIVPMTGSGAFAALIENAYRWQFAAPLGQTEVQVANIIRLLNSTRLFSVNRRWGYDVFSAEAALIERHIQEAGDSGGVAFVPHLAKLV